MRGSHRLFLSLFHGTTLIDEGVVAYVQGGEGLSCKVSNPITDIVGKIHNEAVLLAIQKVKM